MLCRRVPRASLASDAAWLPVCQLVYAWLSDAVPIAGLRRRPYMVLFNLVAAVCFFATAQWVESYSTALLAGVATQVCLCASEVMLDSLVVDRAVDEGGLSSPPRRQPRGDEEAGWQGSADGAAASVPLLPQDSRAQGSGASWVPLPCAQPPMAVGTLQAQCLQARYGGTVFATVASVGLMAAGVSPRLLVGLTGVLPLVTVVLAITALPERRVTGGIPLCSGKQRTATPTPTPAAAAAPAYLPPHGDASSVEPPAAAVETETNVAAASQPPVMTQPSLLKLVKRLLVAIFVGAPTPLWPLLLFVFMINSMPSTVAVLPSFYLEVAHIKSWQFSLVDAVQAAGSALGCAFYGRYLSRAPLWRVLVLTSIVACLGGCSQLVISFKLYEALGVPAVVFAALDSVVVGATGAAAYLPVVVLATASAPVGLEATAFAAVLSVTDLAGSSSDYLSAALTSYLGLSRDNWAPLSTMIVVCNIGRLVPLVLFFPLRHRVSALLRHDGTRSVGKEL